MEPNSMSLHSALPVQCDKVQSSPVVSPPSVYMPLGLPTREGPMERATVVHSLKSRQEPDNLTRKHRGRSSVREKTSRKPKSRLTLSLTSHVSKWSSFPPLKKACPQQLYLLYTQTSICCQKTTWLFHRCLLQWDVNRQQWDKQLTGSLVLQSSF